MTSADIKYEPECLPAGGGGDGSEPAQGTGCKKEDIAVLLIFGKYCKYFHSSHLENIGKIWLPAYPCLECYW